jgi:hypothetical protein
MAEIASSFTRPLSPVSPHPKTFRFAPLPRSNFAFTTQPLSTKLLRRIFAFRKIRRSAL